MIKHDKNMDKKDDIVFKLSIITLTIVSILYYQKGMDYLLQIWIFLLITGVLTISYIVLSIHISQNVTPWRYPGLPELEREDRMLLGNVPFIQGVLFLIIDILLNDTDIRLFKLLVISVTSLFFVTRSYAYIKNSAKWRWRSIQFVAYIFFAEVSVLLLPVIALQIQFIRSTYGIAFSMLIISILMALFLNYISIFFKSRYNPTQIEYL